MGRNPASRRSRQSHILTYSRVRKKELLIALRGVLISVSAVPTTGIKNDEDDDDYDGPLLLSRVAGLDFFSFRHDVNYATYARHPLSFKRFLSDMT